MGGFNLKRLIGRLAERFGFCPKCWRHYAFHGRVLKSTLMTPRRTYEWYSLFCPTYEEGFEKISYDADYVFERTDKRVSSEYVSNLLNTITTEGRRPSRAEMVQAAESHGYKFVGINWKAGGNLPEPIVEMEVTDKEGRAAKVHVSFLPCNPPKQHLYPNFWGYFTRQGPGAKQYGVETDDTGEGINGFKLSIPRKMEFEAMDSDAAAQQLDSLRNSLPTILPAIDCLVDLAMLCGHKFPNPGESLGFAAGQSGGEVFKAPWED